MFLAFRWSEYRIMKKFLLLAGLVFSLSGFNKILGQGGVDAIVSAFKSADATQVGGYFDDFLDMKLLEKSEVKNIGRTQATLMLKSFFSENAVKGFEKTSEREIGNTMYLTGKFAEENKGHNVTVMLKLKDGKWQIISLRIS